MDTNTYLDVQENNDLNSWFNDTVHREMKKSLFSSKDMREFYVEKTGFGNKMISTVEAMKRKFRLRQEDAAEIYYWVALPGTKDQEHTPQSDN